MLYNAVLHGQSRDLPEWRATLFKISDKHYYSYLFVGIRPTGEPHNDGIVGAFGDLDCDGTYSSFTIMIDGYCSGPNLRLNCRTSQRGSISVIKETE